VLLSDTVGFIRKLPHGLVESFKATLEEVANADLLLHVVDLSHPNVEEQIVAVHDVLTEIGAVEKPTLMVFNKVDRFETRDRLQQFTERFPQSVGVSAKTHEGFPEMLGHLGAMLKPIRAMVDLEIPHSDSAAIAKLHSVAQVVERDYSGEQARFKAHVPPHLMHEFKRFIVGSY
jgi:GTP-binding protein HflX